MECYLAPNGKKFQEQQMILECVILSEVKQFQKEACVYSHVQNLTSVCVFKQMYMWVQYNMKKKG